VEKTSPKNEKEQRIQVTRFLPHQAVVDFFSPQHHFVEEWKDMNVVRKFLCFEEIFET